MSQQLDLCPFGGEIATVENVCVYRYLMDQIRASLGGSDGKASACNAGDLSSIPGLGRSPGGGNGNPLQYSCLENPMDGEAWLATVHRVTKNRTRLSDFTSLTGHLRSGKWISYNLLCLMNINKF